MKIFSDNKCDDASVSETAETINYPASNVQDSRLTRIFRGGESIDFDIDGGGELKNISQAYTNLVQDPTDLTTANWANTNSTDEIQTTSISGNLFTKVTNSGANLGFVKQTFATAFSNLVLTGQVLCRLGSSTGNQVAFVVNNATAAATIFTLAIDFDNYPAAPAPAGVGVLLDYTWFDSETLRINFQCDALANLTDDVEIKCYGSNSATASDYAFWTEVQLIDESTITMFPFYEGAKTADEIDETFTMPDRFTFDMIITPFAPYNTAITHRYFSWYIDSNSYFRLLYSAGSDDLVLQYKDSGTSEGMASQQFDDGISHVDFNQRLRIIGSVDLKSGGSSDSRFIVIPLESGVLNEETTWSGTPDIKTSSFPTLSIGHESGAAEADSEFEYLRVYEGLLVGTVADSDDVTDLLVDKKLLLDKTYQTKLTATDLLIAGSTINDGDTITLRGNDVDSFNSGTAVDETVTWSENIITHNFTKASHQYWRLSVNSSNVIDMGRLFLGEHTVTGDISPEITHDRKSASLKSISASGQSYQDTRYKYDMINFTWSALTHTQKGTLIDIFDAVDIGTPFFITFDETESDLNTVYVTIDGDGITFSLLSNPAYYSAGLALKEEV